MSSLELCFLTATELARRIRAREVSCEEVMRAHIDQIERVNPAVNAIVTVAPEQALASARTADAALARGRAPACEAAPLYGLPIAHKEGNWFAPPEVVRQVEAEGAVVLRYCTLDGGLDAETNPNGALNAIAGLVNARGNVLGLMPHPERRVRGIVGGEDGAALVRGLVEAA